MTRYAIWLNPQVCAFLFLQVRRLYPFCLVACRAIRFCVGPRELETREVVIELVFIKTYYFKGPSVMVTMAGEAVLSFDFCGGVISLFLVYTGFDFFVTIQALFIGHFISQCVALRTVEHALQLGVCPRELTRRYLRYTVKRPQYQQRADDRRHIAPDQ